MRGRHRRPKEARDAGEAGRSSEAGIDGRTRMTKEQLADALQHYNDRATARARKDV